MRQPNINARQAVESTSCASSPCTPQAELLCQQVSPNTAARHDRWQYEDEAAVALTLQGMHADEACLDDMMCIRDVRHSQGRSSGLEAPHDVARL